MREMGDVEQRREREKEEGVSLVLLLPMLLHGGQNHVCTSKQSYTCQSHYKLSNRLTGHDAHWLLE